MSGDGNHEARDGVVRYRDFPNPFRPVLVTGGRSDALEDRANLAARVDDIRRPPDQFGQSGRHLRNPRQFLPSAETLWKFIARNARHYLPQL